MITNNFDTLFSVAMTMLHRMRGWQDSSAAAQHLESELLPGQSVADLALLVVAVVAVGIEVVTGTESGIEIAEIVEVVV